MLDTGIEPVISVVGGRRLEDWATEACISMTSISPYIYDYYQRLYLRLLYILKQTHQPLGLENMEWKWDVPTSVIAIILWAWLPPKILLFLIYLLITL